MVRVRVSLQGMNVSQCNVLKVMETNVCVCVCVDSLILYFLSYCCVIVCITLLCVAGAARVVQLDLCSGFEL